MFNKYMPRVCIAVGRFYTDLADELTQGATVRLDQAGVQYDVLEVPGAFEIPAALNMARESGNYAGYIGLGCVIRGETTHYDYVCGESARGLNMLAMKHMAAVGYGILTVENPEQAWERAALDKGNKGKDAAEACLAMMEIKQKMKP